MSQSESDGERIVQERFGTATRAAAFHNSQMLTYLNPQMIRFIHDQDMMFIATADAKGHCDCSFRAGSRGFVRVLGRTRMAYPEYRGNGVMASLGNLMTNPHIGIVFVDFLHSTIGLHVNGTARVLSNEAVQECHDATDTLLVASQAKGSPRPECWVFVDVQEAYIHCSKHVPLLKKLDKHINWGTDDEASKGGDFFQAKTSPRIPDDSPAK
ncbi:MAG TPA: pyridoxamine 5'-phosphate oxidase family protein [Nitrospiraceae bacterium]|nr:pyridoxamine 5'-phosphate oxidase family protein [Nitrospiraceae bacterium]